MKHPSNHYDLILDLENLQGLQGGSLVLDYLLQIPNLLLTSE